MKTVAVCSKKSVVNNTCVCEDLVNFVEYTSAEKASTFKISAR